MSITRLTGTAGAMAAVAAALTAVSPSLAELVLAGTQPQRLADTAGADALVLCGAAAIAWLVWAWGCLGLLLTAAGALPGCAGAVARLLVRTVLPASARRVAAVALGASLGITGPLAGLAAAAPGPTSAVPGTAVPDWPPASPTPAPSPAPDWPAQSASATADHVVVRGDSLWLIAGTSLRTAGAHPSDGDIATAVRAWWSANAGVVGPDPDLLLPGQVLHPPQERP